MCKVLNPLIRKGHTTTEKHLSQQKGLEDPPWNSNHISEDFEDIHCLKSHYFFKPVDYILLSYYSRRNERIVNQITLFLLLRHFIISVLQSSLPSIISATTRKDFWMQLSSDFKLSLLFSFLSLQSFPSLFLLKKRWITIWEKIFQYFLQKTLSMKNFYKTPRKKDENLI